MRTQDFMKMKHWGGRGPYSCVFSRKRQQRELQSMAGKWEATARVNKLVPCMLNKCLDLTQKSRDAWI